MRKSLLLILLLLLPACAGSIREATPLPTAPAQQPLPTPTLALAQATASPALPTETVTPSATPLPPTPSPSATPLPSPTSNPTPFTFAVIGDYGQAGPGEAAVAALVDSWDPALIITTGDNNYPDGAAATIDENIGQYYAGYIYPYSGEYTTTTAGPGINRFFPTLGNHDYYADGAQPYFDYFTLPGNERYYDFVEGPIHFFALNSDFNEPDGVGVNSAQAQWLQTQLAASTAPWKIVYMHVPPYSSGHHGSGEWMRWPFAQWGATAVISGHDHHYERLQVDGILYFVNGLGGGAIYDLDDPLPATQTRFTGERGAMRVRAGSDSITFEFITAAGELVDSHTLAR